MAIIRHEACCCCHESVGEDDAAAIRKQLTDREKNCMWCGEDFDLTEEEIVGALDDFSPDGFSSDGLYRQGNHMLLEISPHATKVFLDIEVDNKNVAADAGVFKIKQKEAIKSCFGVDTDKEKFDPGYVDKDGMPHDRINDAISYEEMRVNELPYNILKFISNNPKCTAADISKKVRSSNTTKFRRLPDHPTSRLYASKLIDCDRKFIGLADMSSTAGRHISGYFGKIPRFSRKYFITPHGEGVLSEFNGKRKEVLL